MNTNQTFTKLTNDEIAAFCSQMSMIVKAGIPVDEGILIMIDDADEKGGLPLLQYISQELGEGIPFSEALKSSGAFPFYMVEMIRLGEISGKLDDVLDSMSVYYGREENIARAVKSAVSYPLVMIAMMIVIVVVLTVKVMPLFNDVYSMLGTEMTGFAKGIYSAGQAISRYALVFIIILAVIIGLAFYFSKSRKGRRQFSRLTLNKKLEEKIALSRFANGLSMTLSSGLDTMESLDMVDRLTEHPAVKQKIADTRRLMEEGITLPEALRRIHVFSGLYDSILAIGDKAGALDEAMNEIAIRYSDDVDDEIENTLSIIEPTLVAVISVIVGLILLSVMFPLIGILANIG